MDVDGNAGTEPERLAIGLEDAAKRLSMSRATVCQLVYSGDIPSFKVGRRRLIPVEGLRTFIAARMAATAPQAAA